MAIKYHPTQGIGANLSSAFRSAWQYSAIRVSFYTGPQPSAADVAATGTLIGYVEAPSNSNSQPVRNSQGMVSTSPSFPPRAATAAGTVGYIRVTDTNGNTVHFDAAVPGDVQMSQTTFAVGDQIYLSPFNFTVPG